MATIQLRRGVFETLTSAQGATGVSTNDVRLPAELMGARLALDVAGNFAGTAVLEGSLDGVNFQAFNPTISVATNGIQVIIVEGVMALRTNVTVFTSGALTVRVRAQ